MATDITSAPPADAPAKPVDAPAPAKPPARKVRSGPDRRSFLRGGFLGAMGIALGGFAASSIAFLWPNLSGGFGGLVEVGTEADVREQIATGGGHYPYPAGRMYLVGYDSAQDPDGAYAEATNGAPFMAIYQKCVHLGCRVPWCASSSWFECPCHGSRYNRWGEYQFGPAPRGLDRFPLEIANGIVTVNTSPASLITGPSRSASFLDQPPAGPHCN